jgi:filamentous hemagglutinin family protein
MFFNTSFVLAVVPPASDALPSGPSIPGGYGSVDEYNYDITNQLHISGIANGTVINWENFDIGSAALTEFHQGDIDHAVLNRIAGGDMTRIFGTLEANGRVFIVNPAGIFFGEGSTVNVTQLVASSLDITNADFDTGNDTGNYEFLIGDGIGEVTNNGTITAAEGVALLGKKVLNTGTITTTDPGGFVVMAAGDRVLLGTPGSKIIVEMDEVKLTDPENPEGFGNVVNQSIDETKPGIIESPEGTIVLAAGDIFSVPLHPQLQAESGEVADQPVRVESGIGTVTQSGTITADGGSVVLTAGNTTAEGDDNMTLDDDIRDIVLSEGSITQAVGGEVIAYAYDFGTKGTTTGAITSFEDGAEINVGTGTADISGNHVLFAGSVDALPGGTVQVDPVTLTIADTMPVTGPELDTLYEEEHIEYYSQAGVNLDLAADDLITVEYMTDSNPVGEITGGSGDINLRNVFADGGIYFEEVGGLRTAIHTTAGFESGKGGNIFMAAGAGGIVAGDLKTDTVQSDHISEPGKIRLLTTNGGDIEVGEMFVDEGGYTEISAIASGNLTVNGDAKSINATVHKVDKTVGQARICLIAGNDYEEEDEDWEPKDVIFNGDLIEVKAHGKYETTADIRISATGNVYIGSAENQVGISAEAKTSQQKEATKATAYTVIHAGRTSPIAGEIIINGQSFTSGSGYLTDGDIIAKAWPGSLSIDTDGPPTILTPPGSTKSVWEETDVPAENFFVRIEINNDEAAPLSQGPCWDCPKPEGLPPVPRIFIIGDDSFDIGWADEKVPLDVLVNDDDSFRLYDGEIIDPTQAGGEWTIETIEVEPGVFAQVFIYTPPSDAAFVWDGIVDVDGNPVNPAIYTDTFTYKAEDAQGNVSVNTATVTISVQNFLPVLSDDSETIHMSTDAAPTNAEFAFLPSEGPDPKPSDSLVYDIDGTPGILTLAKGDNDVVFGDAIVNDLTDTATYEPFEGYVGNDDFDYTITDSSINQGEPLTSATLDVTVTNTPPGGDGWLGTTHMDTPLEDVDLVAGGFTDAEDTILSIEVEGVSSDDYNKSFGGTLSYDGTYDYDPDTLNLPGYVGDTGTVEDNFNDAGYVISDNADDRFDVRLWDGQYDYIESEEPVAGYELYQEIAEGPDIYRAKDYGTGTVSVDLTNTLPEGDSWLGTTHMDTSIVDGSLLTDGFTDAEDTIQGIEVVGVSSDDYNKSFGGTLSYDGTYDYDPDTVSLPGYVGDTGTVEDNFDDAGYVISDNADDRFNVGLWDGQIDYTFELVDDEWVATSENVYGEGTVSVDLTNVLPFAGDASFLDKPAGVPINEDLDGYDLPDIFAGGEIDALIVTLLEDGGTLNPDGTLTTALGGTVTLAPDGKSFTYDPPSDSFLGPDSFMFEVWDGQKDYPIEVEGDPTNVTVTGTITVSFTSAPPPPPPPPPVPVLPYITAAPGLERVELEISGCPALMAWAAAELGVDEGMMEIWIVNALASTRDIQPCDTCAGLKQAATILQDAEGTHIAALAQVINEFASSTAPPTEEQMTSIAEAIAQNAGAGTHYAAAVEYLDALAQYVGTLNSQMGFSIEQSIEFATNKYVEPLAEGDNTGLAAYIAAQLAAMAG